MVKKEIRYIQGLFIFLMVFCLFTVKAVAALDFSVVPVDGGSNIRFSRGDLNIGVTKQVRIRINSTDNTQYQVFQQLVSPFVNERGVTISRPVLTASILSGSTGSGTSYLSTYEPINSGEQLLFTSSPTGMSESFTIVYNVDTRYLSDSGNFTGLLQYSIRPVNGGQRQTVQSNVYIESNAELKFTAEGSTAPNLVRVSTQQNALPGYVKMSFSGNAGSNLKVYAEVLTYPINELNSELDSGILKLSEEGAQNGELSYPNAVDLPRNRVQIYKSTQQSDSFSVGFLIPPDNTAKLMAGNYRGMVRFSFETDQVTKTFDVDLEINISPLFEIALSFPQGPINFNNVLPGSEPQIKEVDVEVKSNLGHPYVVNQRVADLLVNDKGQAVPKDYFVIREELVPGNLGKPTSSDFVPIQQGEAAIFNSDQNGSPTKFKVYYQLSPYAGMNAGSYKTSMIFSLDEL